MNPTAKTKPRGICPVCGIEVALRKNGTAHAHGGGFFSACSGSGQRVEVIARDVAEVQRKKAEHDDDCDCEACDMRRGEVDYA